MTTKGKIMAGGWRSNKQPKKKKNVPYGVPSDYIKVVEDEKKPLPGPYGLLSRLKKEGKLK